MRSLLRDGLFSLSLAAAIGTTVLAFSLIDVAAAPPHQIEGGLVHHKDSSFKLAYVKPGANFAKFKTIQLRTLEIPPDARDGGSGQTKRFRESYILGDKEVAALQSAYSDTMKDILGKAGYTFVDSPGADTLIVAPQVLKIRLNAPIENSRVGYSGRSRTYSRGGGSITVGGVLADGSNGEVLAQVVDHSYPTDMWRINNRVTNLADAKMAFAKWARALKDTLRGE
ncbi:MAG TPA: DUF3313 family protein [Rhizomicrobium sp.]|nr:DUF3313 family protein [Rhizomicrobium sp.]